MIDPKKINFNQVPKKFCDGALGSFNKDSFFIGLTSGNNLDSFAMTPRIMKSISIFFTKHVENYEKQFGEIDMSAPPILSPLQKTDLGGDAE
jgi:hypothetical protein